jgi:DNA-binding winged helix-turn-helix (wHTH) protein/TolB-like protein
MGNLIEFDNFIFNSEIGELVYTDNKGNKTVSRLQPQPTKLLTLLLEHYPNVLTRNEIKKSIWTDIHVDFDGSTHFCIRQIRAALNDDSVNPKFIETIPKVGYRWITEIKTKNSTENTNKPLAKKKLWLVLSLIVLILFSLLFYFNPRKLNTVNTVATTIKKTRIAIMPLQPNDINNAFTKNDIAFQLVEKLTREHHLEIIGPTTTSNFNLENIWPSIDSLNIDLIINGKFSINNEKSQMLTEVIRANDGVHVWVKSFDSKEDKAVVLKEIEKGIIENLIQKN